jgi:predicted ATPase
MNNILFGQEMIAKAFNNDDNPNANFEEMLLNIDDGEYVKVNVNEIFFEESYDEDIEISIFSNSTNKFELKFKKNLKFGASGTNRFNIFKSDFQYIQTNRITPNILYRLSNKHIEKNILGTQGEYTAHYLATHRLKELQIDALKHPQSITNHLLENVSLWLSEISENIEVKTKVYEELQSADLKYSYTYGKTTTQDFTPLNVGFGITYVLPIITAILKAKEGDLIIIENPETHLHPKAQSKIAMLCSIAAANGIQIILETHSDHILNGIRVATKENILEPEQSKIYYFRKDKDNLETKIDQINIDNNGVIDRYPKGFFDQFDEDLDRLIVW